MNCIRVVYNYSVLVVRVCSMCYVFYYYCALRAFVWCAFVRFCACVRKCKRTCPRECKGACAYVYLNVYFWCKIMVACAWRCV